MEDLKMIIAKNISALRKDARITQFELAEKLNYSDKAVSKWERGESVPDITVLKQIADMFSVKVDYLLEETHEKKHQLPVLPNTNLLNHKLITGISLVFVWILALIAFMICDFFPEVMANRHYIVFLYAVPASVIVWLTFNSMWFNRRRNFLIISLLMWSILISLHVSFVIFLNINIHIIPILGIPGQIIILFWSRLQLRRFEPEKPKI